MSVLKFGDHRLDGPLNRLLKKACSTVTQRLFDAFNNTKNDCHGKEISMQVVDNLMMFNMALSGRSNLDEGGMWSVAFELKELTVAEEAKAGALVKKARS